METGFVHPKEEKTKAQEGSSSCPLPPIECL